MLYISRRLGTNKYGVMDTDDGSEEVLSLADLQEVVCGLGIEIKGVDTTPPPGCRSRRFRVYRVNVYQNNDCVKTSQVKMNVLHGVDIKTSGNEITSIGWQSLSGKKPTVVRLSDFGTSCSDYIFSDVREYAYGAMSFLSVILDDKIEVKGKTFKRCGTLGICFDLREVTNPRTVESVYKEFISERYMSQTLLSQRISDRPERMDYWKAVCVLNRGFAASEKPTHIRQIVANPSEIGSKIDEALTKEFLSISNCTFAISQRGMSSEYHKQYITWIARPDMRNVLLSDDFGYLKAHCMKPLFRVLKFASTCNAKVVNRFENYVQHFDVSPEVRVAFVRFCQRANQFLLDFGRQEGWIK